MTKPTIYVSIASYRDPETRATVADLIGKADYPDRIRVSVLAQIDDNMTPNGYADRACLPDPYPQVQTSIVNYALSKGVCWARSELLTKLYQPADFVLQIDSHSRFLQGWDTKALTNYMHCRDPKAVVTGYPTAYMIEEPLPPITYTPHRIRRFGEAGLPVFGSASWALSDAPADPSRTPALAGGCLFARSEVFQEVPYDPHLYFGGEEFTLAARLYTHGYNLYNPNDPWMYHLYDDPDKLRNRHWKDNPSYADRNRRSIQRFRHMLGLGEASDQVALLDIDKYSLGTVRSRDDYEMFAGISLRERAVSPKCVEGTWE